MVLRFLFRYFANNEHLVNKLADSKPIRHVARLVVHLMNHTSMMSGANRLPSNPKEFGKQLITIVKRFSTNFKEELQDAKEELKKKEPK